MELDAHSQSIVVAVDAGSGSLTIEAFRNPDVAIDQAVAPATELLKV